jgi:hypothetical protein
MPYIKPDCTGQKFGYLTVLGSIKKTRKNGTYQTLWRLQCVCGKIIKRKRSNFDHPKYKKPSCGCQKFNVERKHPFEKPDCTGQRLGFLTVLGKGEVIFVGNRYRRLWILQCDCGNIIKKPRADFDCLGKQTSCGCRRKLGLVDNKRRPIDISGRKFGNLTAIKLTGKKDKRNQPTWTCKCDCGGTIELAHKWLTNPNSAKNCRGECPYYYLKYPPTPNPYPEAAGKLVEKYLYLTKPKKYYKNNCQEVEDHKVETLIRTCWIITYKRRCGENISELREMFHIKKSLSFALVTVRRRKFLESRGQFGYKRKRKLIGIKMANVTSSDYPVIETSEKNLMLNFKSKRVRFKRC